MEIEVIGTTEGLRDRKGILKFCQDRARRCQSKKTLDEIRKEELDDSLMTRLIKSGHHTPFEHFKVTFGFEGIPKMMAMIFNNEQVYATSEKSARYTQMNVSGLQKEKYGEWMAILHPIISKEYPRGSNPEEREKSVKKLCQENARYMTSVFTPTIMDHTLDLRQLNFIVSEMSGLVDEYQFNGIFMGKLAGSMMSFLHEIRQHPEFLIDGLGSKTGKKLSLFSYGKFKEGFSAKNYASVYDISLAGLAQAHRHRTITYSIISDLDSDQRFFIPPVILTDARLREKWWKDLEKISKEDYPQALLVKVAERGIREDFEDKLKLRLCGHAQYEIMKSTKGTAEKYGKKVADISDLIKTPCSFEGHHCFDPCAWGKKGIERII